MKIYIIGSFAFAKQMMKVQEELVDTDRIVDGSHSIDDFSANRKHVIENDIISHCFKYDLLGHNF